MELQLGPDHLFQLMPHLRAWMQFPVSGLLPMPCATP